MRLAPSEIYSYAISAGFSPEEAVTFTAIAMAESSGETTANAAGTEDSRGLWQINVSDGVRENTWGDLYDPAINARAAFEISGGGSNIRPWSVTHDSNEGTPRDYRQYLDDAQAAADEFDLRGGTVMAGGTAEVTGPIGQPVSGATLDDTWHAPRTGHVHEGIDIFADEGTSIHAVVGGVVAEGFWNDLGGYVVKIDGDDGRHYYYAHVKEGSIDVEPGQRVEAGEVIAAVGNTGNASTTPYHLHLGIYENGEAVNPYTLLLGLPTFEDLAARTADDVFEIDSGDDPEPPPPPVDTDHDDITDKFEDLLGTDKTKVDSDDDGLSDLDETTKYHTDPNSKDTDGDNLFDADEVAADSDAGTARIPVEALRAGFVGGRTLHSDADGLSDLYEIQHGTDPYNADSDGDSVNDDLELALGSNPTSIDANDDGVVDSSVNAQPMRLVDFGDPDDPLSPESSPLADSSDEPWYVSAASEAETGDDDSLTTYADAGADGPS